MRLLGTALPQHGVSMASAWAQVEHRLKHNVSWLTRARGLEVSWAAGSRVDAVIGGEVR